MKFELKPCPFCGTPAHKSHTDFITRHEVRIECEHPAACNATMVHLGRTEEEAEEAAAVRWNRRYAGAQVAPPAPEAQRLGGAFSCGPITMRAMDSGSIWVYMLVLGFELTQADATLLRDWLADETRQREEEGP